MRGERWDRNTRSGEPWILDALCLWWVSGDLLTLCSLIIAHMTLLLARCPGHSPGLVPWLS